MTNRLLGAKGYWCVVVAMVAFTIYGSYVPFEWKAGAFTENLGAFQNRLQTMFHIYSRSDLVANLVLGIPLGFALLGAIRVDRNDFPTTVFAFIVLWPCCVLFAAFIEFGQLYFQNRHSSGSDVLAQSLGSLSGMLLWLGYGQKLTDRVRENLEHPNINTGTGLLALGYLALLILIQMLPLDITVSPTALFHALKDPAKVTWVPFQEFSPSRGAIPVDAAEKVRAWAELGLLYIPLGVLIAGISRYWQTINNLPSFLLLAVAITTGLEMLQLPVSRSPSSTDVIIGTMAMTFGWMVALALADIGVRKYRPNVMIGLLQFWLGLLVLFQWCPFDFRPVLLHSQPQKLQWLPMVDQVAKNYLWGLNEILAKVIAFVPAGILWAWGFKRIQRSWLPLLGFALAGVLGLCMELGQAILPGRFASPSDVVFSLFGAWFGYKLMAKYQSQVPKPSKSIRPPEPWWKPEAARKWSPDVVHTVRGDES